MDRIKEVEVLTSGKVPITAIAKSRAATVPFYFLRHDENRSEWHLTMFASARAQGLSAQSCGKLRKIQ